MRERRERGEREKRERERESAGERKRWREELGVSGDNTKKLQKFLVLYCLIYLVIS